jgi:thiamine-phosphate pyrophosphorylase
MSQTSDLGTGDVRGLYAILNLAKAGADPAPQLALAHALVAGGTRIFQLRAKHSTAEQTLSVAHELLEILRPFGARLVLNDRVDIAIAAGADGVHLGQTDLPPSVARAMAPKGFLIGLSTHNPAQVHAANHLPVDYLGFGPIFPTTSKLDAEAPQGIEGLRAVRQITTHPLVAIGGITAPKTAEVLAAGANAVAMIGALEQSPDPRTLAEKLRRPDRG